MKQKTLAMAAKHETGFEQHRVNHADADGHKCCGNPAVAEQSKNDQKHHSCERVTRHTIGGHILF